MIKKLISILFLLVLTLAVLEVLLSISNVVERGQVYNFNNFTVTQELIVYPFYTTDEVGILKLDAEVSDTLKYYSAADRLEEVPTRYIIENVLQILWEFKNLKLEIERAQEGYHSTNEFANFAYKTTQEGEKDAQLIQNYIDYPFNQDGFRSIDFYTSTDSSKKKIMLVGDSFVWGMSAVPFYNSFADILLSRGYLVYNMGIIGTDPAQYEAIVKKYTPIIQPDLIIVNLFEGNDYMSFPRQVKYNEPLEHFTNIGFLDANPLGEYLSPQDAFDFYKDISAIPNLDKNAFNRACSKTCVGTLCWKMLYKLKLSKHESLRKYYNGQNKPRMEKALISRLYVKAIQTYLKEQQVEYLFSFIPEKPSSSNLMFINALLNNNDYQRAKEIVFKDIEYYSPKNLLEEDYEEGGGTHFINQGALKYANFLDSLIQDKLKL